MYNVEKKKKKEEVDGLSEGWGVLAGGIPTPSLSSSTFHTSSSSF